MLYEAFEDARGCGLGSQQREILRVGGEGADRQVVGLVAGRECVAELLPHRAEVGGRGGVRLGFGEGGGRSLADELGVPLLGQVPLDDPLRAAADEGTPLVADHPDSPQTKAFLDMAKALAEA